MWSLRQYLPEERERGRDEMCFWKKNSTLMDVKETRTVWRERKVKGKDLNKKSVGRLIFVKPKIKSEWELWLWVISHRNQLKNFPNITWTLNNIFTHGIEVLGNVSNWLCEYDDVVFSNIYRLFHIFCTLPMWTSEYDEKCAFQHIWCGGGCPLNLGGGR